MVVRQTLSLDMIDRLVTDIIGVTEQLMKTDAVDLAAFQPSTPRVEKQYAKTTSHKRGVYRAVC